MAIATSDDEHSTQPKFEGAERDRQPRVATLQAWRQRKSRAMRET
jgi:hypothetical protein